MDGLVVGEFDSSLLFSLSLFKFDASPSVESVELDELNEVELTVIEELLMALDFDDPLSEESSMNCIVASAVLLLTSALMIMLPVSSMLISASIAALASTGQPVTPAIDWDDMA